MFHSYLSGTYCQQREVEAITEGVDENERKSFLSVIFHVTYHLFDRDLCLCLGQEIFQKRQKWRRKNQLPEEKF